MDNLRLRGPADRKRINVHESWELQYWANHFRVTPQQLIYAVRSAGVMVDDVARYLGR
jgi:hypothetical protein